MSTVRHQLADFRQIKETHLRQAAEGAASREVGHATSMR